MANKSKKAPARPGADRKARVEALKRQQKAQERRKTLIVVGVSLLVAAVLIAIPMVQIINKEQKKNAALSTFGVPAASAGCDPVKTDKTSGGQDHVDATVTVDYATAPPSSGRHYNLPAVINDRAFYTTKDTPRVEALVHNLEHGYTVAWYTPDLPAASQQTLKDLAYRLRNGDRETEKFIAAPWDPKRGAFPAGKPIAISHWGKDSGYRQYCSQVSGEAVGDFIDKHPSSDSPEPNAM